MPPGELIMPAPKKNTTSRQQSFADKNQQASLGKTDRTPSQVAQKANMKRQGKDMHQQSGKK